MKSLRSNFSFFFSLKFLLKYNLKGTFDTENRTLLFSDANKFEYKKF